MKACFISVILLTMTFAQVIVTQELPLSSKNKKQDNSVALIQSSLPPKVDQLDIKASFIVCMISDGNVWMATSAGITRYKIDRDEWEHFMREDGLLEDQASSLAFKKDGTLIVGTQCHGLAVFNRNKDGTYRHLKNVTEIGSQGNPNVSALEGTNSWTTKVSAPYAGQWKLKFT
ncbi:MAG: hypothetical protein LBC20_05695 [Planctomycetaceae bacterium]|jgi:hypothetical protein|nr:hypothetical protein [Planctomycetaceae bacterium]